jgi:hypothetical protein
LPSGFPIEMLYPLVIFPMHTTCLTYLMLLDLITVIIYGAGYNVWNISFCYFLHPPVTFFLSFQI